jgi:hypothetical protein
MHKLRLSLCRLCSNSAHSSYLQPLSGLCRQYCRKRSLCPPIFLWQPNCDPRPVRIRRMRPSDVNAFREHCRRDLSLWPSCIEEHKVRLRFCMRQLQLAQVSQPGRPLALNRRPYLPHMRSIAKCGRGRSEVQATQALGVTRAPLGQRLREPLRREHIPDRHSCQPINLIEWCGRPSRSRLRGLVKLLNARVFAVTFARSAGRSFRYCASKGTGTPTPPISLSLRVRCAPP